jgi:uncharacterized protein (TIGR03083 family)
VDSGPRTWIAALRNSHERLAALVRQMSPQQLAHPSYASEWTIAQVLSHLGGGAEIAQSTITAALVPGGTVNRAMVFPIRDAWRAKTPQQQAVDCLSLSDANVRRLEDLSDAELERMHLEFFGLDLDATGVFSIYLTEHALHTWDIAVALDPAAVVSSDAVLLLAGRLPAVAHQAGRPAGGIFRARLRVTDSGADYLLDVTADTVALTPGPDIPGAGPAPEAEIALPAESLLRLVYGRLDPGHTPSYAVADGEGLGRVRAVFPGI